MGYSKLMKGLKRLPLAPYSMLTSELTVNMLIYNVKITRLVVL